VAGEKPFTMYPRRQILILTPLQLGQASVSFRKASERGQESRRRNKACLDAKLSRSTMVEARTGGDTQYVAEMAEERDHGAGLLVIR